MTGPFAASELAAGSLLLIGLMMTLAGFVLLVITLVTIATVTGRQVGGNALSNWLGNFLFLPEVLYLLLLLWLILSGPGVVSVDFLIRTGLHSSA